MSCSYSRDIFVRKLGKVFNVPCNNCADCLNRKKQGYILRMQAQMMSREFKHTYFITLTYDDDHLPYESFSRISHGVKVNCESTGEALLNPYDLRKFFERYRIMFKTPFKYFACGEYGNPFLTKRPHYHIVMFTDTDWKTTVTHLNLAWSRLVPESSHDRYIRYKLSKRLGLTIKRDSRNMSNRVSFGRVNCKCCTFRNMSYVSKYVNKQMGINDVVPPFFRCSDGLGIGFLDSPGAKSCVENNQHFTYLQSGVPCAIPRYLSNKMFSLEQMESFRLEQLELNSIPLDMEGTELVQDYCKKEKQKLLSRRRNRLLRWHNVPFYC